MKIYKNVKTGQSRYGVETGWVDIQNNKTLTQPQVTYLKEKGHVGKPNGHNTTDGDVNFLTVFDNPTSSVETDFIHNRKAKPVNTQPVVSIDTSKPAVDPETIVTPKTEVAEVVGLTESDFDPTHLQMVRDFFDAFKLHYKKTPTFPTAKTKERRIVLLKEEVGEYHKALREDDAEGVLDGLIDVIYIVLGDVLEYGLGDTLNDMFEAVHASNMSKASDDEETAKKTAEKAANDVLVEIEGFKASLADAEKVLVDEEAKADSKKVAESLKDNSEKNIAKLEKYSFKVSKVGTKFVVLRNDGKLIKSVAYKPVNLEPFTKKFAPKKKK